LFSLLISSKFLISNYSLPYLGFSVFRSARHNSHRRIGKIFGGRKNFALLKEKVAYFYKFFLGNVTAGMTSSIDNWLFFHY
jgi:hypothetical protein